MTVRRSGLPGRFRRSDHRSDHRPADVRLAVRAALVVAATAGGAFGLGRPLVGVLLEASPATGRTGPAGLDAGVGAVAAAGALVTLAWWATAFTVAVAAQARATIRSGQPPAAPRPPARSAGSSLVRRVAAAALGVALTAGPGAAHAAVDRPAGPAPVPTASTGSPSGTAATSDLAEGRGSPRRASWSADRPADRSAVVVRPGDTLWSLTAARLGNGDRPEPRAVAAAWPRWWHANRAVVGPDPDLIRPGQVLHPPAVPQEDR